MTMQQSIWRDEDGNILTKEQDGSTRYVMVQYEKPLMQKSAAIICQNHGHILNVGFGCGLVDTAIQKHNITSHTIVEAHPQVHQWMLEDGWGEKSNLTIVANKWQDIDWSGYEDFFDGIYFDAFHYSDSKNYYPKWFQLVGRILKKNTGICCTYNTQWTPKDAFRHPAKIGEYQVNWEVEYTELEIPFIIPEWNHVSPGTHSAPIPYFRLLSI